MTLKKVTPPVVGGEASAADAGQSAVEAPEPVKKMSEAEFLALAEALAKKFLSAKSVDELLPLVRNPETAEARMRGHYAGGQVVPAGLFSFNLNKQPVTADGITEFQILTGEQELKTLAFADSTQGLKIDWESWAGWSEMDWEEFLKSKPVEEKTFRVVLGAVEYYNFDFIEERKWKSYRLTSPDREQAVFGYVERDSLLVQQLHLDKGVKEGKFMLSMKFMPGSRSDNQVRITKVVNEGWLERSEPK